jgi:hypothetical protein
MPTLYLTPNGQLIKNEVIANKLFDYQYDLIVGKEYYEFLNMGEQTSLTGYYANISDYISRLSSVLNVRIEDFKYEIYQDNTVHPGVQKIRIFVKGYKIVDLPISETTILSE